MKNEIVLVVSTHTVKIRDFFKQEFSQLGNVTKFSETPGTFTQTLYTK